MGKSTSFTLGDHFDQFVATEIASGQFTNASEVIRAGLRLLEERKAAIEALRAALIEGEEGEAEEFDMEEFLAARHREIDPAAV